MTHRADAHIHLFEHSLPGTLPSRPGVHMDEAACYDSLAGEHDVVAALVVCYAAGDRCAGNNDFVAGLLGRYPWIRPAAYVDPANPPSRATLERWAGQGFVGLTMYIGPDNAADLRRFPDDIWDWMVRRQWLLSVNSSGQTWSVWPEVLDRHGSLRLVLSHLGLPPKVTEPIDLETARGALRHQAALARFPAVCVKLSGFYALTEPAYDYPHELAWPYVQVLAETFGVDRLLWASDYTPCLNHQTFAQTLGLLWKMPFLGEPERQQIAGGNLLRLLGAAADGP